MKVYQSLSNKNKWQFREMTVSRFFEKKFSNENVLFYISILYIYFSSRDSSNFSSKSNSTTNFSVANFFQSLGCQEGQKRRFGEHPTYKKRFYFIESYPQAFCKRHIFFVIFFCNSIIRIRVVSIWFNR